jgi:6-methylsalicylate decarboxylase
MRTRIDVHHHLLTPSYLEALAQVGVVESGGVPFPQWTPEDSLSFLDRAEIQTALLSLSSPGLCFGNATKESQMARALNEFAAQTVMRWPKRFGFFATLPLPDVQAALAEIDYALDTLHADGIVLLSNYAGIYLGDERLDPIFAELDQRSAVVFIHPTVFTGNAIPSGKNVGSPIPTLPGFMLEFVFDTTRGCQSRAFRNAQEVSPSANHPFPRRGYRPFCGPEDCLWSDSQRLCPSASSRTSDATP